MAKEAIVTHNSLSTFIPQNSTMCYGQELVTGAKLKDSFTSMNIFPIPLQEILNSQINGDPTLEQNPGY